MCLLPRIYLNMLTYSNVGGANVAGTSYIHIQTIKRRTKSPAPMKTTRAKPFEQRNKPRGKKSGPSIGMQMRMLCNPEYIWKLQEKNFSSPEIDGSQP
ncbi:hypothetical protein C0J52_23029 [Blattella germanica]|nr:hypothetical protein C0J52_23029 [Blattella germanica]